MDHARGQRDPSQIVILTSGTHYQRGTCATPGSSPVPSASRLPRTAATPSSCGPGARWPGLRQHDAAHVRPCHGLPWWGHTVRTRRTLAHTRIAANAITTWSSPSPAETRSGRLDKPKEFLSGPQATSVGGSASTRHDGLGQFGGIQGHVASDKPGLPAGPRVLALRSVMDEPASAPAARTIVAISLTFFMIAECYIPDLDSQ